ncbi:HAE1 family hydrophobic/amphiphilic exporter-1 [Trinickia symbiotica]|uniref:Efflux pump membrane transporter n=1 Tax=Trinickia symbiotica TaxID=863227 RepID=A0A2N7WM13_9BURK|nr:multidrug efflux RND transporter permease subunit [Trinickia symbiotica]PMS30466.1 multidrug efflux RND transporter permease subunit [Trinickia symbiotica]PPK41290.1 HAE1 family hydrophobic/amphiphilic exporter-1 [Trinickia symbiotica]
MPSFFIDRPVFAWIVALGIVLAGVLAMPMLPVMQYPKLTPPRIVISASYPGASAEVVDSNVASVIEESLDGVDGLQYYATSSDGFGNLEIDAIFAPGTNPDIAMVGVQNRMKQVEPRLPQQVVQQGIGVFKATNTFLMLVSLVSTDGTRDSTALGDYLSRYVLRELKRAPGVGNAELWDADEALRIWLDPMKLREYGLAPADVNAAIRAQNAAVTAGAIGNTPSGPGQAITASVSVRGQLRTPAEFANIVLKAQQNGALVRLGDVARVELGRSDYTFWSRLNGHDAATVGISLAPDGNALATSKAIRARLAEISKQLPPGVAVSIPYDGAHFVKIAIDEVVVTLLEAIVLVFCVMWLFLRDLRYTLVPSVVIPVALMGALAAMAVCGLSINVFTLFGLVLAIGILVDDAIVVVENVERIMREEGLSARAATKKAMTQIGGAIVGVTAVLTTVFVPMAFFAGGVGGIYRQFAIAMIAAILVSAFMALSLAPALCASLRMAPKPAADHAKGFGGRFVASFDRASGRYRNLVARLLRRSRPVFGVHVALIGAAALMYASLPDGFLPTEDQGQLHVMVQLPPGATQGRTFSVIREVEDVLRQESAISNVTTVIGWSFNGSGQNVGMAFVDMKDWKNRDIDAQTLRDRLNAKFDKIAAGRVIAQLPPSVPGLGKSDGFTFHLEDRGGAGNDVLNTAREQLLQLAARSPVLADVHSETLPDAPRVVLNIDRAKAYAMNVSFDAIDDVLANTFGTSYVDDFPAGGRMLRVMVGADASMRATDADLLKLDVRNASGQMVPFAAFASLDWTRGPTMLTRYNGYPSLDVTGRAADGYSSGEAMAEMERLAARLPEGIAYDWADASLAQTAATRETPLLIGLSMLAVFMVLAALYESWTIPFAVLIVVPLAMTGAVAAMFMRGLPNDIYFKIGMVTVIGLAAKNAILIVQFARDLHARGMPLVDSIVEASAMRFRPIVMTSAAFLLGVVPLVFSQGAGAESRHSLGTGVFGGVIAATLLGLVFTPVAFYFVMRVTQRRRAVQEEAADRPQREGDDAEALPGPEVEAS